MSEPGQSPAVTPPVAWVFATVGFVALLIFGLGVGSLLLEREVIAEPGLGAVPGVVATVSAVAGFGAALWFAIRGGNARYRRALWCGLCAWGGYVVGVVLGAAVGGVSVRTAFTASGTIAIGWVGITLFVVGVAAGWAGIALSRTRSQRPRWPWEDPFDA